MRRFFYFIFKEYIFAQNANMFIHIIKSSIYNYEKSKLRQVPFYKDFGNDSSGME